MLCSKHLPRVFFSEKCLKVAAVFLLPGLVWAIETPDRADRVEADALGLRNRLTAARESGEIRISGRDLFSSEEGEVIHVSHMGEVVMGDLVLEADRLTYDKSRQQADIPGEAKIKLDGMRIVARDAQASLARELEGINPNLSTGELRMGMPPGYMGAKSMRAEQRKLDGGLSVTTATLEGVKIYYQEPDFWSLSVDASRISYTVEKREEEELETDDILVRVEEAIVRIAGIPVFYLPSYEQRGLDIPPVRPELHAGQKRKQGVFLRTTTYFVADENWQPGLLLDGYTKSGVLVGPALRYQLGGDDAANSTSGGIESGWIKDQGDRGTDDYGNPISANRWFLEWNHKQRIADAVEITSSLNYWSDTSVLRDFRPSDFNEDQRPDSFFELVRPDNFYYASLFARYRPNDFQNVQQRLPEVRFDLNPVEFYETGIYQHFSASATYLEERSSAELSVLPGGADEVESPRIDFYYGLTRPVKPVEWFTFTPVAGVRSTTYFQPTDGSDAYTRVLPQVGFDMQLLAQGQWNYQNEFWGIRGLRHQLRPVMQYRWIPAAEKGGDRIPVVDRSSFVPYPSIIDLGQRRDTDDLWAQQLLRIGVENVLQTQAEDYGSRDLAWFNVYQDFRDTDRVGERTLSDTYLALGLSPAYWLQLELYNRLDPYSWNSNEITSRIRVRDGDRWSMWFGSQYITDVDRTNQFFWGGEYNLNSEFSVIGQWRFDREIDKLTEQYYGVRQRLGNSWTIEYSVRYRERAREDSDFSFGLSLRLSSF